MGKHGDFIKIGYCNAKFHHIETSCGEQFCCFCFVWISYLSMSVKAKVNLKPYFEKIYFYCILPSVTLGQSLIFQPSAV